MRVALQVLDVEADFLHEVEDLLLALRGIRLDVMDDHRFLDGSRCGEARVKTRIGVLEDHLEVLVHRLARGTLKLGDVLAVIDDLAARGLMETNDAAAEGLTCHNRTRR